MVSIQDMTGDMTDEMIATIGEHAAMWGDTDMVRYCKFASRARARGSVSEYDETCIAERVNRVGGSIVPRTYKMTAQDMAAEARIARAEGSMR